MFTYLTNAEFVSRYLGANLPVERVAVSSSLAVEAQIPIPFPPLYIWAPTAKDWTTVTNVVTPVKNQGGCGSCWAFSAVAALESLRYQGYGQVGCYSEQQLVSCSSSYGNNGCGGGWMNKAFNYVKAVGITTQALYPYTSGNTGLTGGCITNGGAFKISGYTNVNNNCAALATAVLGRPISVAVDASRWSGYSSGIFKNCNTNVNHGVLLVGVNSTTWKIKNSWGKGWGMSGFMLLSSSGGNNTCNICGYASYPNK